MSIVCGDCRRELFAGQDVMITDPPYRADVHSKAVSQSIGGGVRQRDLGFACLTPELRQYTCHLASRVARWSCIFSDMESITLWRDDLIAAGAEYIRAIPWVRWSMPQLSGDRPPTGAEIVIIAHRKSEKGKPIKKRWNGPGNLTHFDHTCMRGAEKHRAEKPLDLMLDLVSWFSNRGEIILDPFAGSGTTGLAAKLLGRGFVGSELDPVWAEKANARLSSILLSERDAKRHAKWQLSQAEFLKAKGIRDAHTAKIRWALGLGSGLTETGQ